MVRYCFGRVRWIRALPLLTCLATGLTAGPATACLWDKDTLAMERERFPGALELITGEFVHHGPDFYAWRIDDRSERLQQTPGDLGLLDDLAVAYDKTGDHDAAIATMQTALAIDPDRYESHANIGTFHAHAGRFEQALEHIDRAIQINPDAHFGREVYQRLLIKYVVQRRAAGQTLPLGSRSRDFARFVLDQTKPDDADAELTRAIKGVMGMMHFGRHDSPVLLEALGDLLSAGHPGQDARQLAARAYLRAAQVADDRDATRAYRSLAKRGLHRVEGASLRTIEASLDRELARGQTFVAQMRRDEETFLDSPDPEAAFDAAYFEGMDVPEPDPTAVGDYRWLWWLVGAPLGIVALSAGAIAWRRRRRGF